MNIECQVTRGSLVLCAVVAVFALGACTGPSPTDAELRVALAESLVEEPKSTESRVARNMAARNDLLLGSLYKNRNYSPIWVGPTGANERGRQLLAQLSNSDMDALDPGRYGLEFILDPLKAGHADALASAEIYFSRVLMRYAGDLRGAVPDDITVVAAAGASMDFSGYLDSLVPRDPSYRRLRAAMRLYRGIAKEGGWETIPAGAKLRPGVVDPRVILLRRRLGATGDMPAAEARSDSKVYDDPVVAAVRRFQGRHGLYADGIAGKRTIAAMNVSVEGRLAQISESLEQHRSGLFDSDGPVLVVNVAAQELVLIDNGEELLRSKTIVGRPDWQTPLLSSTITSLVVNPTWTVPRNISTQEILPRALKKGGSEYLQQRGFSVLDFDYNEVSMSTIDWETLDPKTAPYYLRQSAGRGNALGKVKFPFPNGESIFLHDTPSHRLFNRSNRALSHGCVRVEKADELAVILMEMDSKRSKADYKKIIKRGEPKWVKLERPVTLHIVSITVWVEEDGIVQFRDDPYETNKTYKNKNKSRSSI